MHLPRSRPGTSGADSAHETSPPSTASRSGVIACSFDDPHDAQAAAILREAYPGREVVPVDARPLFERGGGIHCITQQQPATTTNQINP